MRSSPFRPLLLGFLTVALPSAAGCDREPIRAASGNADLAYDKLNRPHDVLVRYFGANPDNLNPILGRDAYSYYVSHYLFDPLYRHDPNPPFALRPALAESLPKISDDRKTFTIRLRTNASWHDGTPVTAHDVVFGYSMAIHPDVDSAQKKAYTADVETFEAVEDHTLRIRMRRPYAFFGNLLTQICIVPKHVFESMREAKEFNTFKYPAGHPWAGVPYSLKPLGNGAYRIERFEPHREIRLVRYDGYWGGRPNIREIHGLILTDTVASRQHVKRGDLDQYTYNVVRQWVKEDRDNEYLRRNFNAARHYRALYYYLGWNLRRPLFRDRRVRHALARLMNVDAVISHVELGHAKRCRGPYLPESSQADPGLAPLPFDPLKARALLDEAGWKDTDGDGIRDRAAERFEFELLIPANVPRAETVATVLQEEAKKAGLRVTIRALEWNAFSEAMRGQTFDALFSGWASPDPEIDAYQIFHSSQAADRGSNYVSYHNERVDALIEKARQEFDPEKRGALCREINRLIYDDQPYCFLYHPEIITVVHKRFRTGSPSPLMGFDPRMGFDWKIVGPERP
ncbi:MAG: hypothetical protein HY716_10100 [Planctomycetes bacterium]|nr:hypothetical protein [Planctomycetota bacterium]